MIRVIRVSLPVLLVGVLIALAMPASAQVDFAACAGYDPANELPSDCLLLMESYPDPTVININEDRYTLYNYSFWKVNVVDAPVFDAPGGGVVRAYPAGFHFVRAIDASVEGWVQIEDGGWMQTADLKFSPASDFTGVQLLDGLNNPFAWALDTMFTSAYPGGPQDSDNGRLLYRFDLVNLFAQSLDEEGWRWYMVGPDQWVEQRVVSKPLAAERPEGVTGRWVSVDLYEQALVAYENDTPVFATLIASGLPGTETVEGVYNVWAALPQDRMSGAAGAPNAYDLSTVPWVQYFDGGISLHGTYWHANFGYRRSRGCVNLSISDARWVFEWADETYQASKAVNPAEPEGISVVVWSSGEYRSSGAATK
jgi:hypothetical protein